ncbi:MAG TPA: S9 family peptidase [Streptosporangiaceae bacterium]
MAIPRVGALRLSPDGSWLAATVQTLSPDRKKYLTSVWRVDTQAGPARRLTRSAEGEGNPVFLPDGSLLFISRRSDPDAGKESGDAKAALWLLPAGGGEARVIAEMPGGVAAAGSSRASDPETIVISSRVMPGAGLGDATGAAAAAEDDERLRKERADAGVTAILHESAPVRYWDHDLGPDQLRLFAVDEIRPEPAERSDARTDDEQRYAGLRDLTPEPGAALDEQAFELMPDGSAVITGWAHRDPAADSYVELVTIDVATGKRRTLLSEPGHNFENPHVSPDGRYIVCTRETLPTRDGPADCTLMLLEVNGEGTTAKDLLRSLDRWPAEAVWAPDSTAVYFAADDDGRRPIFRVDVRTGEVTPVTTGDGAYVSIQAGPEGRYLYALRNAVNEPPTPVRIDLSEPGSQPTPLLCPGAPLTLPGRLTELETTADDGQRIRSWLVLPDAASPEHPVPLLLWVHGGPNGSWNTWSWRWNPWLMAARGYAVLLPDPALSTGYGQHMLARGQHSWGARAFDDVMAATDAAIEHPAIDGTRTGMMGGSYGGYMANWIAGHTDRFKAIVSHASLWALDQMFTTTDEQMFWWGQFGDPLTSPEMYQDNSPHLHVGNIRTPMLVIHGDKDYRVPIGEALRLWGELTRHGVTAKFLYFPDENHWVLTPGNATVWYETVFAFLAEHVLAEPWQRPPML